MSVVIALVLASSPAAPAADAWLHCARAAVIADLATGAAHGWGETAALPEGIEVGVVALPSHPSGEAFDAVHRVLYAVPTLNQAYVASSGGLADIRRVHGPVSLAGRCVATSAIGP